MRRTRGFTLIELVVTVAIISVLALVAVPLGEVTAQRLHESELRTALRQIREAIDAYKKASDDGRILRRFDGNGYPTSLDELANGVSDAKSPNQQKLIFLRRLPRDPFYPDGSVPAADTWGKRSYESPPDRPEEGDDVFDVYSLSPRKGLNGVPYREW